MIYVCAPYVKHKAQELEWATGVREGTGGGGGGSGQSPSKCVQSENDDPPRHVPSTRESDPSRKPQGGPSGCSLATTFMHSPDVPLPDAQVEPTTVFWCPRIPLLSTRITWIQTVSLNSCR